MGKHKGNHDSPGKMTVMVFQLEGSDSTLQEGFRTISTALSRILPVNQRPALSSIQRTANLSGPVENGEEFDGDSEVLDVTPPVPPHGTKVQKRLKSPQVLDIDLSSGDASLKEFIEKHPTEENNKRYLLIAHWLKVQRQIEEVSMDHIHTGFRHMGWQTPKDATSPLRSLKRAGWFHKGNTRGFYKINHVGENEVMKITEGKD